MPNLNNITSPLTLIAPGRSGTSLLSGMLARHPDCSFIGETANLIFDVNYAVDYSISGVAAQRMDSGVFLTTEQRTANVIRQTFLELFPDEKLFWLQKPIGVPARLYYQFKKIDLQDEAQWVPLAKKYWDMFKLSFPNGRYFTLLRHPCDIVLSTMDYWGILEADAWAWVSGLFLLFTHQDNLVKYAIKYEDLYCQPVKTIEGLCEYLGISYSANLLDANEAVHAFSAGRATKKNLLPRSLDWGRLNAGRITALQKHILTSVYHSYGYELEWPDHFISHINNIAPSGTMIESNSENNNATIIKQLKDTIARLNKEFAERVLLFNQDRTLQVENISSNITELSVKNNKLLEELRAFESELEYHKFQNSAWQARAVELEEQSLFFKKWIQAAEEGKSWLEEQLQNYKNSFESLGYQIAELQHWNRELQASKKWLEEQLENYKHENNKLTGRVLEIENWNGELESGKAWLETQLVNYQNHSKNVEEQLSELHHWNHELEVAKAWLENQLGRWQEHSAGQSEYIRVLEHRLTLVGYVTFRLRQAWAMLKTISDKFTSHINAK